MSMVKGAVAALFIAAALAGVGCSDDDDRDQLFELDEDIYTMKFSCNQTPTGQPTTCRDFNESAQIRFELLSPNVHEARYVPDTGYVLTGSFSGFDFEWTAINPNGDTESGTWTFSSEGNTFSGPSHYVASDLAYIGDCNTNGDVGAGSIPDPPAPMGCP